MSRRFLLLGVSAFLIAPGMAYAQSGNCVAGPKTTGAPGSFVYSGGGTTDNEGNVVCFDAASGSWKTITTEYGQFRMQTLADQWPDGDVFVDSSGAENFTPLQYEGFRRLPENDAVTFATLDPISRVARHSAPAVVEVFSDRCFQYDSSITLGEPGAWRIGVKPNSGFFVNDSTIVTAARVREKIAFDEVNGVWGEAPFEQSQQSCSELEATMMPGSSWEQGAGPFVRLFDGRWAAGSIVASSDEVAVIRLDRVTSNGNTLVSTWAPWDPASAPGDPLPFAPSGAEAGTVLAIHHPEGGRNAGGWHLTTGQVIACSKLNEADGLIQEGIRFAVDLFSDLGSLGAPVLDDAGFVRGVIAGEVSAHPDVCKEDIYRGKNNQGILSDFIADPPRMTSVLPIDQFRSLVLGIATGTPTAPAKTEPAWPSNAATVASAKFEVVDWGTDFTPSGFPKSALHSDAFDVARQATLMFTREVGCAICEENARTDDFSTRCLCTGFAITNNLIVTNDHCVATMVAGSEATFRTYAGQDVGAVLVGKSSVDGVSTDVNGREYDSGHKGDVALLRTNQRMDLTPVRLADSDKLRQYDPVLAVGHPYLMSSSGPFVVTAGSMIGSDPVYEGAQQYILPASPGSSGSGVFNLDGELVGQVKGGGAYHSMEQASIVSSKYGKRSLEIDASSLRQHLVPRPFEVSPNVSITTGLATDGAPSNYIRKMVEQWAPGALDGLPSQPPTRSTVTLSGQVTNIVTGAPVSGATVTVGTATATTSSDGRYSVVAAEPGHRYVAAATRRTPEYSHDQPRFSVAASGFHTRESSVSMTGPTTVNVEIIPQDDGFDLAFFDHSFRDGSKGTTRWLAQPSFEIWTQIFRCVEPCAAGNGGQQYEATAEVVPAYFEARAREAIALVSDLTGGFMVNPVISTKTHPVGTLVDGSGGGGNSIRFMYANKFDNAAEGGRTWISPGAGAALTGSHLSFNQSHSSPAEDNSIYIHELAHAVGFIPGHTADLSLVPGPSIMGPNPVVVTAKDRLHTKILYKRPIGSVSPDRDPTGTVINGDTPTSTPTSTPTTSSLGAAAVTAAQATDLPSFSVNLIPAGDPLHGIFHKYMKVFGVSILAFEGYPDDMIRHVGTVTAEYLDNNEDGVPDNLEVNAAIAKGHGTFVLVLDSSDEWHAVRDRPELSYIQELTTMARFANKGGTICGEDCGEPSDTALEHVPELIQRVGYATVFEEFAPVPGSRLALAMDAARGGDFRTNPDVYPEGAWYTAWYPYELHFIEYFYWGLVTNLGLVGDTSPGACAAFVDEWKLCTKSEFQATDTLLFELLTDPKLNLPTVAPDGVYR